MRLDQLPLVLLRLSLPDRARDISTCTLQRFLCVRRKQAGVPNAAEYRHDRIEDRESRECHVRRFVAWTRELHFAMQYAQASKCVGDQVGDLSERSLALTSTTRYLQILPLFSDIVNPFSFNANCQWRGVRWSRIATVHSPHKRAPDVCIALGILLVGIHHVTGRLTSVMDRVKEYVARSTGARTSAPYGAPAL